MKKIFTLLFAVGLVAVAQAQTGSRDNRQFDQRNDQRNDHDLQIDLQADLQFGQMDFDKGYDRGRVIIETNNYFDKGGRYNDRIFMERKKAMKIAMINREYDLKIQKVKRNFRMSWFEKQRLIRMLENQRRWEISLVNAKFNKYRFDGRDNRYDRNGNSNGHY